MIGPEWGDDPFWPLYRKLNNYTGYEIPIVACTATARTSTLDGSLRPRNIGFTYKTKPVERHSFHPSIGISPLRIPIKAPMALRLRFYVIILLLTIVVAVSSRPSYNSKATRVKKDTLIALRQFDPKKARRNLPEHPGFPKLPKPSNHRGL